MVAGYIIALYVKNIFVIYKNYYLLSVHNKENNISDL